MNYYKRYTKAEHDFLRKNYKRMTNAQLAKAINRTMGSVGYQLTKLNLVRGGRKIYTIAEIKWLKNNASKMTNKELAEKLCTTTNSIKTCIMNHHISPGRIRRFEKGHRPWNFRTKGIMNQSEASKRTQFKKGHLPHTTLHDGAITIRFDHPKDRSGRPYKWIRVSVGKWVHYHRWLWEQKNGPVPKKHMVIFRDGDTMNTRLSNLKLISMAENARRNVVGKQGLASRALTDNYIAGRLAGGDKKLRKALILGHPELIELKRTQLKLKRQLNHERDNTTRKAA